MAADDVAKIYDGLVIPSVVCLLSILVEACANLCVCVC